MAIEEEESEQLAALHRDYCRRNKPIKRNEFDASVAAMALKEWLWRRAKLDKEIADHEQAHDHNRAF